MIPLPKLPAPVRVLEFDLGAPLPSITGCGSYRALRVLVRLHGVPVGWVTVESPPPVVSPAALFAVLAQQLPGAVSQAVVMEEVAPRALSALPAELRLEPVSVVVCTRDRATSLRGCLESLLALDHPAFEVVVVDNAPRDDATRRLADGYPVRYVREDRPGLDWARNRGITESRHPLIAFTDDDVRVDPAWLRAISAAFQDPETMLVTGLIAPAELETRAQVTFEYGYGGMDKGVTPRRRVARAAADLPQLLGAHHLGAGANMAFRRQVFDRVGGFDTALDVGTPSHGGGDLDMFYRVLASGAVARYEPAALVWHTHRRDFRALSRQLRDNGRAFGVYLLVRWMEAGRKPGGVSRLTVFRYGTTTWLRWMAGRVVRRLRRQEPLPLGLQFAEIAGMLASPWAFQATRRQDARLRASGAARRPAGTAPAMR